MTRDEPKVEGEEREGPDRDDTRERLKFSVGTSLRLAAGLQKRLPIDEVNYRGVAGHAFGSPRAYFLYGVLDEVLKASTAGLRWLEFISSKDEKAAETRPDDPQGHMTRLVEESVVDEQQMWARKLTEVLVDVILFGETNEEEFYRLYLICKELDAYLSLQRDFGEFFACRSANADWTIQSLLADADRLRSRIDITRAWFLGDGVDLRRAPKRGWTFQSLRARFMRAQQVAAPELRLVLRPSYEMAYVAPSRSVHLNVGGPVMDWESGKSVASNAGIIGFMSHQIAILAYRLAGVDLEGEAKVIADALANSDDADKFRSVFQREFGVGDLVLAYGNHLCQVVGVAKSRYGYTSYRVRYFIRPMLPGIHEDWFPSQYVHPVFRHRDARGAVAAVFRKLGVPEADIARLQEVDDERIAELLAQSAVELVRRGLFPTARTADE